jgi:multisubunit Na+/H+ antiporter MnhE subunit
MATVLTLALPFSVVFMALSGQTTWQGFLVGYVVSVLVLQIGQADRLTFKPTRIFSQVYGLLSYSVRLAWDIFVSSVDVARMVLSPNMNEQIDPGLIRISTQDEYNNEIVTAMSSHGITITPGQLVVDVEREEDITYLYVHNLHVAQARESIVDDQTERLTLIRRILGYDV